MALARDARAGQTPQGTLPGAGRVRPDREKEAPCGLFPRTKAARCVQTASWRRSTTAFRAPALASAHGVPPILHNRRVPRRAWLASPNPPPCKQQATSAKGLFRVRESRHPLLPPASCMRRGGFVDTFDDRDTRFCPYRKMRQCQRRVEQVARMRPGVLLRSNRKGRPIGPGRVSLSSKASRIRPGFVHGGVLRA